MARRRNPPEMVRAKWLLADRLRTIRTELFGERGLAELARRLEVPIRTWYSYETGVTVPAEVLLAFVELTRVEPLWLLHGHGPKYQTIPPPAESEAAEPDEPGWAASGLRSGDGVRLEENGAASAGAVSVLDAEPVGAQPWQVPAVQTHSRCVRIEGDAMAPIVSDGAFVAYSDDEEDPAALDGKLVYAEVGGRPMVRWFHRSGHFGLLRAENPAFEPTTELVDLDGSPDSRPIRRVLWIGTAH